MAFNRKITEKNPDVPFKPLLALFIKIPVKRRTLGQNLFPFLWCRLSQCPVPFVGPFKGEISGREKAKKNQPSKRKREIGFESGFEGWIGAEKGVALGRDTLNVERGQFSLNICGKSRKRNATVAGVRIPAWITGRSVFGF